MSHPIVSRPLQARFLDIPPSDELANIKSRAGVVRYVDALAFRALAA